MPLDPGSPEAIREGCRCSATKNRDGKGAGTNGRGEPLFIPHLACGLHGSEDAKKRYDRAREKRS